MHKYEQNKCFGLEVQINYGDSARDTQNTTENSPKIIFLCVAYTNTLEAHWWLINTIALVSHDYVLLGKLRQNAHSFQFGACPRTRRKVGGLGCGLGSSLFCGSFSALQ